MIFFPRISPGCHWNITLIKMWKKQEAVFKRWNEEMVYDLRLFKLR